jgi:4-oxalocrotonate tautomerase
VIVLKLTMRDGRSDEQKEELHRRLTDAAVSSFGVDIADVRSAIYELPTRHWAKSGISIAAREEQAR